MSPSPSAPATTEQLEAAGNVLLDEGTKASSTVTPFESDDDYWQLVGTRMRLRVLRNRLDDTLRDLAVRAATGFDDANVIATKSFLRHVDDVSAQLDRSWRERCDTTGTQSGAPIMLQVAKTLPLSDLEADVIHFLIFGALDPRVGDHQNLDFGTVQCLLSVSPADAVALISSEGVLVRNEILRPERDIIGLRRRDLKIEVPMMKLLRGLPMMREDVVMIGEQLVTRLIGGSWLETLAVHGMWRGSEELLVSNGDRQIGREADDEDADEDLEEIDPIGSAGLEATLEPRVFEAPAPREIVEPPATNVYSSNLEYLSDYIEWFKARYRWKEFLVDLMRGRSFSLNDVPVEIQNRNLEMQERVALDRIRRRLAATRSAGAPLPRVEELAVRRGLDEFEKNVLLLQVCMRSSSELLKVTGGPATRVGEIIEMFSDTFEEKVAARSYFYRDATLIRDGLLLLNDRIGSDLLDNDLSVDRAMIEYVLGVDKESASIADGSHLYRPAVDLDRVILAPKQKNLILDTVTSFPAFVRARKETGLDDLLPYGGGIVMLFHGASGTGKTMMANALATRLGKKVLLVNFPSLGSMFQSDETLRLIFREARIEDAVIFFDECEGIFQDRTSNPAIALLLTELERYDGLVILATNRPLEMDEAMHRRITLAVEFHGPDAAQREEIWRSHIPPRLHLASDVDLRALAERFELTGGLIKNAVLAALAMASSSAPDAPMIDQETLERAARLQVRSTLRSDGLAKGTAPERRFEDLVLAPPLESSLRDLIGMEKSKRTLIGQWGFGKTDRRGMGTTALFVGPPGTGKTIAAETVAFELGRSIRIVNVAQLVSKWVGEGPKNLEAVFASARGEEAVLVFDEADALFAGRTSVASSTDRYANLEVAILLRELEQFPGVVILTTNLGDNIDPAFRRRIRVVLQFPLPDAAARERLWRLHIPSETPCAPDLALDSLAGRFELSGGAIRNAVLRAASRAALRPESHRVLTTADLAAAAEEETRGGAVREIGFGAPAAKMNVREMKGET